jgi:hypothetical protein
MTVVFTRTLFTKFITVSGAVLCLMLFSQNVFAQDTSTEASVEAEADVEIQTDSQQTARENTQADRAPLRNGIASSTAQQRTEVQGQSADPKTALEARTQERVTNLAANMSNRMEAVIERLQNITNRLESRIIKMSDSGVDTTASAAALASAQLSLDEARTEIRNIDVSVYTAVSSADVRAGWTTLKAKFTTIKNFIKTAHSELRSSITLLKEASLEARAQQNAEVGIE